MPVSKKRKKKSQDKYLDQAQLAQYPKKEKGFTNQQIAIIIVSALIIFAMATSLIFSGLAPTVPHTVDMPDSSSPDTSATDNDTETDSETTEEGTEETTE